MIQLNAGLIYFISLPSVHAILTLISLNLLSRSSNSTIVPLFEKVLSASDAGRIGRLVLPKACAEVFFIIFHMIFLTFAHDVHLAFPYSLYSTELKHALLLIS